MLGKPVEEFKAYPSILARGGAFIIWVVLTGAILAMEGSRPSNPYALLGLVTALLASAILGAYLVTTKFTFHEDGISCHGIFHHWEMRWVDV